MRGATASSAGTSDVCPGIVCWGPKLRLWPRKTFVRQAANAVVPKASPVIQQGVEAANMRWRRLL